MEEIITRNRFIRAIEKNQLLDFALGKGEYFIQDTDYGGHSVIRSYNDYILPVIKVTSERFINPYLLKMMDEMLQNEMLEEREKYHMIFFHLHVYYYLRSENLIKQNLFKNSQEINKALFRFLDIQYAADKEVYNLLYEGIILIQSRGGIQDMDIKNYNPEHKAL